MRKKFEIVFFYSYELSLVKIREFSKLCYIPINRRRIYARKTR